MFCGVSKYSKMIIKCFFIKPKFILAHLEIVCLCSLAKALYLLESLKWGSILDLFSTHFCVGGFA
jgi:hypothetical protein